MVTVINHHIKKSKKHLKRAENRYSLAVKGTNDGLWDWNLETNTIFFSTRWKRMLHYDSTFQKSPQEWLNLVHPHDVDSFLRMIKSHFAREIDFFNCEHRIRNKMGDYIWVANRGRALSNAKGEVIRFVGLQTDITQRKKAEERLIYNAFHDDLTELPNRSLFMDRLNQVLLSRSSFAVLYMDIDHFKEVNDTLGHEAGNKLLMIIAKRLENCRRGGDTVARLGGDEFTLLLANVRELSDVEGVVNRVLDEVALPFEIAGEKIISHLSIGIALGDYLIYKKPEDIIRDADIALYQAKHKGKGSYEIFNRQMSHRKFPF